MNAWLAALIGFILGALIARWGYRGTLQDAESSSRTWHREHGYRVEEKERLRGELYDAESSLEFANHNLAVLKHRSPVIMPESEALADAEAKVAFRDAEIRVMATTLADHQLEAAGRARRADDTIVMYEKRCRSLEDENVELRAEIVVLKSDNESATVITFPATKRGGDEPGAA